MYNSAISVSLGDQYVYYTLVEARTFELLASPTKNGSMPIREETLLTYPSDWLFALISSLNTPLIISPLPSHE